MKCLNLLLPASMLLVLLLVAFESEAQVQQGDINAGVNGFVSATSNAGSTTTTTAIFASGQYYITDNISLGFGPQISFSGSENTNSTTTGFNFFGNYNFLLSNGQFLPYAGANLLIQSSSIKSDFGASTSESKFNYTNFGFNVGGKYFFTERINFDANLGYTFMIGASGESNGTTVALDADGGILQFTFGLGVIIGKRGN